MNEEIAEVADGKTKLPESHINIAGEEERAV